MTATDLVRCNTRDRATWGAFAWVVVALLATLGTLFLVGGIGAAATARAYVVVAVVPGGLHTHGGITLALAAMIAAGLVPPIARRPYRHAYVRAVLMLTCGYEAWIAFALASAWRLNGTNTSAGVVWWLAGLALSIVLIVRSPRADREGSPPCTARRRST